ncbi:actin nucleation-promoting factor WASL isoform X1 [Drosophila takahashii]|uniref:actin nucleation-promoting factor WASL isoform X1 n=1 Tax=Drosophila takahashii TaxID=29030 RepID=UPI001CF8B427|nr:neural Wiskott-Aldrich syndrome protein isoform X1 [Drosophila takahashii]XP_017006201.2 neural Wiskott-Aldrich syndrome protein isoform X1 [Drosophila takahashii]
MSSGMRSQDGPRAKVNAASTLLTQEENEAVFRLLGKKCQTLNTAVVQIYKTEGSAHAHWKKRHTGVVCFVKDSAIRSYFMRAYCLIKNELIWEHEIYDGMQVVKSRPFLLTFEGSDGHVGLNFVSEEECDTFFRIVDATIETRNRKRQDKRNRQKSQPAPNAPLPPPVYREPSRPPPMQSGLSATDGGGVQLRNNKINSVTLTPAPAPTKNFLSSGFGLGSQAKDKKRKVTKADISQPTNFVHISHVGWDADKGFDLMGNENDPELNEFFLKAGVSETELKDRDTRAFIYDFIQSNNVLASVKQDSVESPTETTPPPMPPPVPTRHPSNGNQRTAPPPPPARQPPPPVPVTAPGATRAPPPPSRPPPISTAPPPPPPVSAPVVAPPPPPPPPPAAAAVPPPPPPPMPVGELPVITTTHAPNQAASRPAAPAAPDSHNALMDAIRKGTQLKKVDAAALSTSSGDSRSDLMKDIRQGTVLKPAKERELGSQRNSDNGGGTDALADALRRALAARGNAIHSDEDETESSDNEGEWD